MNIELAKQARQRALKMVFDDGHEVAYASLSDKDHTFVAIATPSCCGVVAIDAADFAEYPGLELARLMGAKDADPASAMERTRRQLEILAIKRRRA